MGPIAHKESAPGGVNRGSRRMILSYIFNLCYDFVNHSKFGMSQYTQSRLFKNTMLRLRLKLRPPQLGTG